MVHPVVILVIGVVVGTALIHMSARIAGVEDVTLLKAFKASVIGVILALAFDMIYPFWGIAIALMLEIVVIKFVYDTMLSKAGMILFLVIVFFGSAVLIGSLIYRWVVPVSGRVVLLQE
ncbi:MAG: hypothetical protein HXS46_20495 [Theionarchaea archaeon]|nr:MAG: hypothetical protein AYK18_15550 [Theionarchaea archaeon DG-70]MBU7013067.1 hypothetical protein [Theionarchaea archaeon]